MSPPLKTSQRGSSLISVLVAVGLIGVIALILSSMFKNQFQSLKIVEMRGEREDLRQHVRLNLNCARTFPGPNCSDGFVGKNKKGDPITTDPAGKKIGKYEVKGRCKKTAGTKKVDYTYFDPKTMKVPKLLFDELPRVCP